MALEKELSSLENLQNISYDTTVIHPSGKSAKDIFCAGWPAAKTVLESVALMIKNPIVKMIIGIIVKAGDALSGKICV